MNPKTKSIKKIKATAPYCFLSYSSKEPQIGILIPCLWIAFSPHFELKLTPSALESGASQRAQIVELIKGCTFAVVALDGLRPNVTFEYGLLEALNKPVILLKEKDATVDIRSYLGDAVTLGVTSPKLTVDSHFSNVKDLNYAEWNRLDPAGTVKLILQEYRKKKSKLQTFRLPASRYGLSNYRWYDLFAKIGRNLFFEMEGSGRWEVEHFREESDETGPYVAVALKYKS